MDRSSEEWSGRPASDCEREAAQADQQWRLPAPEGSASRGRLRRLLETLESDVIPRLVDAHRGDGPAAAPGAPAWPEVEWFARQCTGADDGRAQQVVMQLRQAGAPVERLCTDLFAPAARTLGQLWEEDRCDFTDVTVGVGRLQQMLRALSPAFGKQVGHPVHGRRIMLLPAPEEQHTFGLSMVAEFFRAEGWDVAGAAATEAAEASSLLRAEWFDVLGVSVGHRGSMPWVRRTVAELRQASRNPALVVMLGGPLMRVEPEYGATVSCDAVIGDGREAPRRAEQLLAQRTRPL